MYALIVHYKTRTNGHWGFNTECYVYKDMALAIERGKDAIIDHRLYSDEDGLRIAFEFIQNTGRYDFASAFVEVVEVLNNDQSIFKQKE